MERTNEAINLFKQRYGKTPKESGFPVIDIYEKQHAFLYAVSEDVIGAYKTQQNILRWMFVWFLWPMIVVFCVWLIALAKNNDIMHPLCVASYIFYGVWAALLAVMSFKVRRTISLINLGTNITYLNYDESSKLADDVACRNSCYENLFVYSGLGKEPYWNEPLSVADDYTVPRYVYADKFESVTPNNEHGRVIGYRISPTLVIHSMVMQDYMGMTDLQTQLVHFINEYGGKMLTEEDIPVLRENWNAIDNMRTAIGDTLLPKYIIPFVLPDNKICTAHIFDGRVFIEPKFGSIVIKR